jgi:hypothetical protein
MIIFFLPIFLFLHVYSLEGSDLPLLTVDQILYHAAHLDSQTLAASRQVATRYRHQFQGAETKFKLMIALKTFYETWGRGTEIHLVDSYAPLQDLQELTEMHSRLKDFRRSYDSMVKDNWRYIKSIVSTRFGSFGWTDRINGQIFYTYRFSDGGLEQGPISFEFKQAVPIQVNDAGKPVHVKMLEIKWSSPCLNAASGDVGNDEYRLIIKVPSDMSHHLFDHSTVDDRGYRILLVLYSWHTKTNVVRGVCAAVGHLVPFIGPKDDPLKLSVIPNNVKSFPLESISEEEECTGDASMDEALE